MAHQNVDATVRNTAGALSELRARFNERLITADDAEYDEARTPFYGGFDRRPLAIVRPTDAAEVAHIVTLARDSGVELAIRSGGHSMAGHSLSDGGIVLDLKNIRELEIDPVARTAWAEAGLTAGEYTAAAAEYGLATGFGDTGSVGIGGITLGGGIGYLVRKYGLTIDSLLAAEIVTADGECLYVDADNHPDLFWAIRGGGGNFGVVTRFKFRLHPVDRVVGGFLILPATPESVAAFIAAAEAAPEELSTIANIMVAPPMPFVPEVAHGKLIIFALMVYAGPVEEGERVYAPFRAIAEPLADMIQPMHYPDIFQEEEGEGDYHPTAAGRNLFLEHVGREEAERMIEYLTTGNAPMRVVQLRVLGGAMARVPVEATAFAHRQAPIMANVAAFYNGPEDRAEKEAWVEEFAAALKQGYDGMYVNFVGDEGEAAARNAYPGETWERLAAIKARYDPTNLFRLNHNITPATNGA